MVLFFNAGCCGLQDMVDFYVRKCPPKGVIFRITSMSQCFVKSLRRVLIIVAFFRISILSVRMTASGWIFSKE